MVKQPPHNTQSEEALIWAMLIDQEVVEKFFEHWQVEWFYDPTCSVIIKSIFNLALSWENVDVVSVSSSINEDTLKRIGGMTKFVELTETANSYSWKTYSNTIEELYKRRELIKQANTLISIADKGDDIESAVEKCFSNINSALIQWWKLIVDLEEGTKTTLEYIEENKKKEWELIGWSWWNEWLDKNTRGIRRGKTYRIGAPSGVGKTNLVYQTIISLVEQWAKVMFVSLENSIETTLINISCTIDRTNSNKVEKWEVEFNKKWFEDNKHLFHLTDQLLNIDDIKREVLKVKPDVVILDYIGLVEIKGCDEKTLYNKYADIVKHFVQRNKWLSWIDLSNLNKDDDEEKIRGHKGFNGAAKLRNNTDFGMHLFYYKPFYEWRKLINEGENEELKARLRTVNAITFLISKQRGGTDWIEEQMTIDYNNGYNYSIMSEELKNKLVL